MTNWQAVYKKNTLNCSINSAVTVDFLSNVTFLLLVVHVDNACNWEHDKLEQTIHKAFSPDMSTWINGNKAMFQSLVDTFAKGGSTLY